MSSDYWIRKFQVPVSIIFWFWLTLLVVVSVLPSLPNNEFKGSSPFRPDYLFHFGAHFVLVALFLWWKYGLPFYRDVSMLSVSLAALLAVAVLTELVQKFIPGRTYNIWDMVYNLLGVLLGWLFVYFFLKSLLMHSRGMNS